ncbi:MAG: peptidylprolyl isomerase, partial [Flavobacteriales bacterium]|nr:peptidylprolyl isomerase [Flavobacteriales bacterium]
HLQTRVLVETDYGNIELELFENTPLHRANFLYMIERDYYTQTEIIRVVKNFVIQGGNSDESIPAFRRSIIGKYTIPAEITKRNIHLRGALAMSRSYTENPSKRSSPYDFYIVHGKVPNRSELLDVEMNSDFKHSESQLNQYKNRGGAIHLDGEHTVFGKVVSGMEAVDAIANLPTDASEWPNEKVVFRMSVLE